MTDPGAGGFSVTLLPRPSFPSCPDPPSLSPPLPSCPDPCPPPSQLQDSGCPYNNRETTQKSINPGLVLAQLPIHSGQGQLSDCSYLRHLGLVLLLRILHSLQVVSGTIIVYQFPAPLGNSLLARVVRKGADEVFQRPGWVIEDQAKNPNSWTLPLNLTF